MNLTLDRWFVSKRSPSKYYLILQKDFPSVPMVKNPPFNAGDAGSIPSRGTKIPHASGLLSPWVAMRILCATSKT